MTVSAIFAADSFRKSFGRKEVLKSASLWATPGRVTAVMGRNGSGKTTLIRAAVGLIRAEQGVVRFAGTSHLRPNLWRLASQGLFYLADRNLLSRRMTLGAQLELVASRFGGAGAEEVLATLEVDGLLDRHRHEVSSGERRRIELALAVARRPTCLIADEPFASIEPRDRELVGTVLRRLADSGVAVLVTGHEVRELLALADEIIWMTAGTTLGLGTPDDARRHHRFRHEYLGPGVT